ncbi:MAG: hypothetical protein AAF430_17350 [Myxococcota bacterium]
MLDPTAVLLVHAGATWFMTGLIWFVQVVHYPLFGRVAEDGFVAYENAHTRLTTWVVGPPMLLEVGTLAWLSWTPTPAAGGLALGVGAALLALIWISTALLQVPRHQELSTGFDGRAHRRLVTSNWVRTVAWSLRAALVLWMVAAEIGVGR